MHAAGNMISLKLIIEEPDIVEKINSHLAPQIRVWGIERTTGSFSCYQACDSRWYEYLIPSNAFLPPHPSSHLAKELEKAADESGDREGYESRQEEVKDFWAEVEANDIKPLLDGLDADVRSLVEKALYSDYAKIEHALTEGTEGTDAHKPVESQQEPEYDVSKDGLVDSVMDLPKQTTKSSETELPSGAEGGAETDEPSSALHVEEQTKDVENDGVSKAIDEAGGDHSHLTKEQRDGLATAIRALRSAYENAKRRWRIPTSRVARIQAALDLYKGTCNFHNYTVAKAFRDPSAKRQIKSFLVNTEPILINGTEWLSLKVHGQSFMMHQIRKMVAMATLVVRCGTPVSRISESYQDNKVSIPKAPGLGLLLERPVFDSYNNLHAVKHGREQLNFGEFEDKIEAFKKEYIYERIFEEEKTENTFQQFFNHVDGFKEDHFLWVTSLGLQAVKSFAAKKANAVAQNAAFDADSEDDNADKDNEG